MAKDNEVEGTPVSTSALVMFTAKFAIIDSSVSSTTITCGDESVEISLKKQLPAYKLCDVNNDNYIKVDDARLALRTAIKLDKYDSDSVPFLAANINNDEIISVDEARIILRTAVNLDEPACGHKFANVNCITEKYCTDCGVKLVTKGAHSYSVATCTSGGKCTICGATGGNALGHSWDSGYVSKAPSCLDGIRTYKCTRCGITRNETISGTNSHAWDSGKITTYPTSAKEGVITKTCKNCGQTTKASMARLVPSDKDYSVLECMMNEINEMEQTSSFNSVD